MAPDAEKSVVANHERPNNQTQRILAEFGAVAMIGRYSG
jgi:hypothetical protein